MANALDLFVDARRAGWRQQNPSSGCFERFSRALLSGKRNFPGARRVLQMPGGGKRSQELADQWKRCLCENRDLQQSESRVTFRPEGESHGEQAMGMHR